MNKKLFSKCKKIKLVISDVDGVLTDGGMYYSNKGEFLKKFNTRDGVAVQLLLKNDIKTVIMTKEKSMIVKKRAKKIHASLVRIGILKKDLELMNICKKFGITAEEIAYLGDDINDLEIMKRVGFSAAPADGALDVRRIADYVCKSKGGEGVLREIADLILTIKFPHGNMLY